MVHHRELCDNYSALGIRQNNLVQLHILTILAIPKSCSRLPSCQLLLLSIPVGLHTQWIEPENYPVGTQTTVTTCATLRLNAGCGIQV